MNQKPFILGIPAYTTFQGGGLMHFLLQAIPALAQARPQWEFEVVGSIALPELRRLETERVHIHFWDDDSQTRFLSQAGSFLLNRLGKGSDAGFLLQKYTEISHIPWGIAQKRTQALRSAQAVWIPHYNLSLNRIDLAADIRPLHLPILLTIHDIHPAFYPEDHPTGDLARFYQGFVPLAQSCQHIFTHSDFQKAAIVQHLGIPAQMVSVTAQPPLIDPQTLLRAKDPSSAGDTLACLGIEHAYAFYPASTAHVHKNHARLITAWLELKKRLGERCPLLVCTGTGNRRQFRYLTAIIHSLGLQNDIRFTGSIPTTVLATLFEHCEMVVIPTLYEGAGSGILTDALVTGKPVACADIPQVREQLAAFGPVSITFFDPRNIFAIASAVQTVLMDVENQKAAATKNQAVAQIRFHEMWQTWAERYATCIEQMYG